MKRFNWIKTVGAGVAMACLALPLAAQGATKAELLLKAQQHRALTTGKAVPAAAVVETNDESARTQRQALHAKKSALIQERRTLAKQGNMDALNANSAKIANVDAALKVAKKGGAKL